LKFTGQTFTGLSTGWTNSTIIDVCLCRQRTAQPFMTPPNELPSTSEVVLEAIREHYGIEGILTRLPGENLNYLVEAQDGRKWVAKIADQDHPAGFIEMEHAALLRAKAAQLGLLFPQIIENIHGKIETGIFIQNKSDNRLRLLDYVPGTNWSDYPDISTEMRFDLGQVLARFDRALAGFDHPQAHRKHRWDLADAGQHRGKVDLIREPEKHQMLAWAFGQWTNHASPFLSALPWQYIHGDGNPENIRIVDGKVTGLLDFGDSCYNPRVCELAICLAYQMMDQKDPWAVAEVVIAGYESLSRLSAAEKAVLEPLVCGRLAVTLSVAAERHQIDAGNTNWFVSVAPAWDLLEKLRASTAR